MAAKIDNEHLFPVPDAMFLGNGPAPKGGGTSSAYTRSYGTITGTGVALPDGTYVPNGYMATTRSIAGVSVPVLLLAAAVAVLLFKKGRLL